MSRNAILSALLLLTACGGSEAVAPVDPNNLPALTGKEQALLISADHAVQQGNIDTAEKDYQSAISASTGHLEAHLALAKLYAANHQDGKERTVLERATALQPNNPGANYLLGKLELAQGHPDAARLAFEHGLTTVPDDLDLTTALAVTHDMLGHHDTAQTLYKRMLKLHKTEDLTAVKTNLAMSYLFSNEPRKAAMLLEEQANKPGFPTTSRHNLALAYGMLDRNIQARDILKGDIDEDARKAELKRLKDYIKSTDPEKKPPIGPVSKTLTQSAEYP